MRRRVPRGSDPSAAIADAFAPGERNACRAHAQSPAPGPESTAAPSSPSPGRWPSPRAPASPCPGERTAAAADATGPAADATGPVLTSREAPAAPLAPYTRGTTLASVATPRGTSGYRRLGDGPGWRRVVRGELAGPRSGRAGRRVPLAAFIQLTDLHLTDTQHPLRLEYLRAAADPHAWRPQEALTVQGAIALVERVNALRGGPVTGAPLRFAMTTGDNTRTTTPVPNWTGSSP
ncbi:hypothetical protein SFUMM280S_01128 [Streptomyces fumanus]